MEPTTAPADRRVVNLLGALVALVALLVVGLAAGGALLWREYARLERAVGLARDDGGASLRDVLAEASRRQQAIAAEMGAVSRDSTRQIADFERRAEKLREQGTGGAIDNAKRAVEMTQLMSDELLLQLKLMRALDDAFEKATRPAEVRREARATPKR
jgi:hypothetical protein